MYSAKNCLKYIERHFLFRLVYASLATVAYVCACRARGFVYMYSMFVVY